MQWYFWIKHYLRFRIGHPLNLSLLWAHKTGRVPLGPFACQCTASFCHSKKCFYLPVSLLRACTCANEWSQPLSILWFAASNSMANQVMLCYIWLSVRIVIFINNHHGFGYLLIYYINYDIHYLCSSVLNWLIDLLIDGTITMN